MLVGGGFGVLTVGVSFGDLGGLDGFGVPSCCGGDFGILVGGVLVGVLVGGGFVVVLIGGSCGFCRPTIALSCFPVNVEINLCTLLV